MAEETVIVGCKLPGGLLLKVGEKLIRINGKSKNLMPIPGKKDLNTDVMYADGLTTVPKAFWDAWQKQYKDYPALKSGHLYASPSRPVAEDKAKDTALNLTGLEQMNPLKVAGLEPTDETKKLLQQNGMQ